MAINIDQMLNIDNDGTYKFGISKRLDELSLDEIWENCYCGANLPMAKGIYDGIANTVHWTVGQDMPLTVTEIITNIKWIRCSAGNIERDLYSEDGYYVKTLLLYSHDTYSTYLSNSTLNKWSMVLQLDMTRTFIHFNRSTGQSTGETSPVWGDTKSYAPSRVMRFNKGSDWGEHIDVIGTGNIAKIYAFQIIKYKDKYCILDMFNTQFPGLFSVPGSNVMSSAGFYSLDGTVAFSVGQATGAAILQYNQSSAGNRADCVDENYRMYWQARSTSPTGYNQLAWYPNNQDTFQDNVKMYGCYFETDKIYKPIIDENNYVTGWTDVLTTPSAIDNWVDNTKHVVPDAKPSPTPSEDAEAETFGWGGNEVAGMVRYYLLSQSEMEELQAFMSDASWRMDYRNCIIGMYVVPNGGLFFDAVEPTTLKFRIGLNEAEGVIPQDQELDTGIDCLRISGVVNNESAVIELPRINGNFLDFEPYSKYMVYVPFCGVIPLPDYVAGKEIKVSIFPDVPTCTCTAVVTSEGRKIATAKGAYGSQLPVTSDGDGLKAASVINSIGNFIMGAGEVALGIGTGMVPLAIAGGAQMLGSGLQTDLQLGQAYGYSIGASGDTSFFGAGNRCEYYVAYSKWNNPDVDEGELQTNIYGHTYGFVCNKRGILKDFEGFTVCDNPHVYGFSCTSDEKDEIERLLREGIIIHMSEE